MSITLRYWVLSPFYKGGNKTQSRTGVEKWGLNPEEPTGLFCVSLQRVKLPQLLRGNRPQWSSGDWGGRVPAGLPRPWTHCQEGPELVMNTLASDTSVGLFKANECRVSWGLQKNTAGKPGTSWESQQWLKPHFAFLCNLTKGGA